MIEGHLKKDLADTRRAMLASVAAFWILLDLGFDVDLNRQKVDL